MSASNQYITKGMLWSKLADKLTYKQYCKVTAKSGRLFDNYFNNVLKYTKSKDLHNIARLGLRAPAKIETNRLESFQLTLVFSAPQTLLERELQRPIASLRVVS